MNSPDMKPPRVQSGRIHDATPCKARMRGRMPVQTLVILVAAIALGAGLWAGQRFFSGPGDTDAPQLRGALAYPTPRELPPFELRQADGTPLDAAELAGRWTLVFFGFTHCPDVCPTTLAQLAAAQEGWSDLPAEERPQVLFVSVDPERDSPAKAGEYARFFGPEILAATAGHEVLEPFARSLGMLYMQAALDGGGGQPAPGEPYTVDHSSKVAVLDPQVRLTALLKAPLDAELVDADLRALMAARR